MVPCMTLSLSRTSLRVAQRVFLRASSPEPQRAHPSLLPSTMARPRRSAQRAAANRTPSSPPPRPRSLRLTLGGATPSTPVVAKDDSDEEEEEEEDVEMQDAQESTPPTPKEDQDDEDVEASDVAATTPAPVSESESETSPVIQPIPRKRRPGRPPKNPRPETPGGLDDGDGSERTTPAKRGRGRPGRPSLSGSLRGRPRGGPSHVTKVPVDKEGNMVEVIDDEVALPEDPQGEAKVDKMGNLQGGRDYRVRVFTITGRGDRLYMLSTEPARCTGFRDSYLFFTKHQKLYKIIVSEAEKQDLIAREIIPHSYKGRAIGVVTARSVFREFGARIIIGGRRVIDDYEVRKAKQDGIVEGEIADLNDRLPPPGEPYNKNQYVAWHGASAVYHTGGPSVPTAQGKLAVKKRINITSVNWMVEHARAASRFNSTLSSARRLNLSGVYDPHTNFMHYPRNMQPTHVRWEQLNPADSHSIPNGVDRLTNGVKDVTLNGTFNAHLHSSPSFNHKSIFIDPPVTVTDNYLVVDTVFESAPLPYPVVPGPDGDVTDVGPNGLANIPVDIVDELPPDCRAAFEAAKQKEVAWRQQWAGEGEDTMRGEMRFGLSFYPN